MHLLHIDSSIFGAASANRQLTGNLVHSIWLRFDDLEITYRDLVEEPLDHYRLGHRAVYKGGKPRSPGQRRDMRAGLSDLDEFLAADIVVIGAPTYNFSIPSQLKAWLDRIVVSGQTFESYGSHTEGLVAGKKVIIASTRGDFDTPGTPLHFLDAQESYLRGLFAFLGVTDIRFVRTRTGLEQPGEHSRERARIEAEVDLALA